MPNSEIQANQFEIGKINEATMEGEISTLSLNNNHVMSFDHNTGIQDRQLRV